MKIMFLSDTDDVLAEYNIGHQIREDQEVIIKTKKPFDLNCQVQIRDIPRPVETSTINFGSYYK